MGKSTRMELARSNMLIRYPFFATLMLGMEMIPTTERPDNGGPLETMATDMKNIYYNPEFAENTSVSKLQFIIAHETMHTALEHGYRLGEHDPETWNQACDFAVNDILKDSNIEIPEDALYDPKYHDMNAEQIYDLIMEEQPPQDDGDGSGDGSGNGDGEGKSQGGGGDQNDLEKPGSGGDAAQEASDKQRMQQQVAAAANMARLAGDLPAGLERLVDQLLNPQVPWVDMLREYMMKVTQADESWNRRNRRFRDVYLPARHSEQMGEIVIIGDTSGSITNEELMKYVSEAAAIAEDCKPEKVHLLWADTKVAAEQTFEYGEQIVPEPAGYGGTDMRVPLKRAEDFEPECVVLFTDGYTPWPDEEPPYPLIVCCTTEQESPVGITLRLN